MLQTLSAVESSSSLDASEKESRLVPVASRGIFPYECSPGERFRHSGWSRFRGLLLESLKRTMQPINRIACWESCGYKCYLLQSIDHPKQFKVAGSNCHDRFCQPCARLRSQCIAGALVDHIGDRTVRLVTLTLKHRRASLSDSLDRLYTCFSKLRRTQCWMRAVEGGAAFIELTWSERSGDWHPHLHVLCTGRYLAHQELKNAWYRVTGDSHIVDIRLARDKGQVTSYVTKYVTKVISNTYINRPDLLDEAVCALKGRKLCLTFGSWRGLLLTFSSDDTGWVNIGSYDKWMSAALRGDSEALSVIDVVAPLHLISERANYSVPLPDTPERMVISETQTVLDW